MAPSTRDSNCKVCSLLLHPQTCPSQQPHVMQLHLHCKSQWWPWEEAGLQTLLCWASWQGLPGKEGPHPPSLLVTPLGRGPGCAHQQECLQLVDVDLLAGQEAGEHQLPHLQPFASISLTLCNTARSPAQPAVSMAQSPSSPSPSISTRTHPFQHRDTAARAWYVPAGQHGQAGASWEAGAAPTLLGLEPSTAGNVPGGTVR